jgi:hypothetical protein
MKERGLRLKEEFRRILSGLARMDYNLPALLPGGMKEYGTDKWVLI